MANNQINLDEFTAIVPSTTELTGEVDISQFNEVATGGESQPEVFPAEEGRPLDERFPFNLVIAAGKFTGLPSIAEDLAEKKKDANFTEGLKLTADASIEGFFTAGKQLGKFNPVSSPFIFGHEAYTNTRDKGGTMEEAVTEAIKAGGFDLGITLASFGMGKLMKIGGRKLSTLMASGKSEKVTEHIFNNPNIVFEPKKKWQAVYTKIFDYYKGQKKQIGELVGKLKEEAFIRGHNLSKNNFPVINQLDEILDGVKGTLNKGIAKTDTLARKTVKQITDIVAKKTPEVKGAKVLLGPDGLPFRKDFSITKDYSRMKNLSYDDWIVAVNEIDGIKGVKRILEKVQKDGLKGITNTERQIFNARSIVRDTMNSIIEDIPVSGAELIEAKARYANFMKINTEVFRNLTLAKTPKAVRRSLLTDQEGLYDSVKEFLPADLYDDAVSKLLNESSETFTQSAGRVATAMGKWREVGERIGRSIPKAGAMAAREKSELVKNIGKFVAGVTRITGQEMFIDN